MEAWGVEGPEVNDAPVERQSRPRPSREARIESHRFRQTPSDDRQAELFYASEPFKPSPASIASAEDSLEL